MDIRSYKPSSISSELNRLLREKYGNNVNFDYFLRDFNKSYDFCLNNDNISFYPIAGFEGEELRAHIALIIDKRLSAGEAFFGFLEIPDDSQVFDSMWSSLMEEAHNRGISVLKGPINGSIWHQYRCIKETDGSPLFKTEVFSELYYHDFLKSKKPSSEADYFSASREPYDIVLKLVDPGSFNMLSQHGFRIEAVKQVPPAQLKTIADISRWVFKENWGYTELNDQEFIDLYSSEKLKDYLDSLYLLYKGTELIGYCSTSEENKSTLTLKTICVLPVYRGLGLGNALAYKIHLDAKNNGFKKIIYALIREGNSINNFPKEGTVIFRRYAAFEYKI